MPEQESQQSATQPRTQPATQEAPQSETAAPQKTEQSRPAGDADWKASILNSVEGLPPKKTVSIQADALRTALGDEAAQQNGVGPHFSPTKLVELSVQKVRDLCK